MLEEIKARVERAIAERVFPGCVVGVVRADGVREVLASGRFRYELDAPSVEENTVYDIASVTKSIPVASLVLTLISEGTLSLDDVVKTYVPELQNDFGATIEDLLRYRVRGPRLSTLEMRTFEQIRTAILEHGFDGPPGKSAYANAPAYILGLAIERATGSILPALADKYFFGSLRMHDTTFFPHDRERIAPTEIVGGVEIRGIVHDESARVFSRARRTVGHAGLFSTVPDLLNFLEALLQGKYPQIVEGAARGLGWQVNQRFFMGKHSGEKTFGKTGFTGTSVVCDVERGAGIVLLSNRTYPTRPSDAAETTSAINAVRADIADFVFGSI